MQTGEEKVKDFEKIELIFEEKQLFVYIPKIISMPLV